MTWLLIVAILAMGVSDTISKLANEFGQHAIQDAGHFGELRGMLAPVTVTTQVSTPKV